MTASTCHWSPKGWHDRHMNQVDKVVGMETMQGTSIIECHLSKLPLTNVQLPGTETREKVDYIGSLLSWKCQSYFSGIDTYSEHGFAFSCIPGLSQNHSQGGVGMGVTKCLVPWYGLPCNLVSDQGLILQQRRCGSGSTTIIPSHATPPRSCRAEHAEGGLEQPAEGTV